MLKRRVRASGLAEDNGIWDESSSTAITIFESEQIDVIDTGLLDQHGEPILRRREKIKMGFVK